MAMVSKETPVMATEDETIERVARDMDEPGPSHSAKMCINARPEKRREIVSNICSLLRPGDRLPGGLIVAREEPDAIMVQRGCEAMGRFVTLDDQSYSEQETFAEHMVEAFKAMLAAQWEGG